MNVGKGWTVPDSQTHILKCLIYFIMPGTKGKVSRKVAKNHWFSKNVQIKTIFHNLLENPWDYLVYSPIITSNKTILKTGLCEIFSLVFIPCFEKLIVLQCLFSWWELAHGTSYAVHGIMESQSDGNLQYFESYGQKSVQKISETLCKGYKHRPNPNTDSIPNLHNFLYIFVNNL